MITNARHWPALAAAVAIGGLISGLTSGAMAAPAAAPARAPAKAKGALTLPTVERFKLDNGLEVAFMPLSGAPAVSVQVWYRAGSKDEPRDRQGSAHMFEHMMFRGSQHLRSEDHERVLSALGGYVNAGTTEDSTRYVNVLPADYLDYAISLEAERMRNLLFRKEMVDTEREVVKEEIRQQENNPLAMGLLRFLAIAFTKHPYAWTAGGTIADLDKTAIADLKKFYDTYYVPSNALLVVVGNVGRADVEASAKKHFGPIPGGGAVPRPSASAVEPPQTEQRREVVDGGQVGLRLIGYKIPEAKHVDVYALQALSLVLGAGDSSRLMRTIKTPDPTTKQSLGIAAGSPVLVREDPGLFLTFGVYIDRAKGDAVEKALLDEVARVAKGGVTADELRKAKNQIQASFVFGLQGVAGLADQIGTSWILTGDPGQFLRDVDEIEKLTPADLQRVARTYLDPSKATVVVVPPIGGQK